MHVEETHAEEGPQRKRRGRIGSALAEHVGSASDTAAPAAFNGSHDQADVLEEGSEDARSKGDVLMECVVKVSLLQHMPLARCCCICAYIAQLDSASGFSCKEHVWP